MGKILRSNLLPDLKIRHRNIEMPNSDTWDLISFIHLGGVKIERKGKQYLKVLERLPLKNENSIRMVERFKVHAEGLMNIGYSEYTVQTSLDSIRRLIEYSEDKDISIDKTDNIRKLLFAYSEKRFEQAILRKIKHSTAHSSLSTASWFLNGVLEDLRFDIRETRLFKEKNSRRALGRRSEKIRLEDAAKLASFCFELTRVFDPRTLRLGELPIRININSQQINLTPARKLPIKVDKDFTQTQAYLAFNFRVSAEVLIFLAMTLQNQAPTYNLRRTKFTFKPLGENYEVREFKSRRGGEVLFKIPKNYRVSFENYLSFIDEYAPNSQWLFPYLEKYHGYRKRQSLETDKFKHLCSRYEIPWVNAGLFRSIGENILLRLSSDVKTAADYANHAVATFRSSYEFPSLQRSMIEIGRFWVENDPLTVKKRTVSLFNSPCSGVPEPFADATHLLPKPDCVTPTGCIGCVHYRDEDSLDYVWGLHSFKFLKVIESSSHLTREVKPSNIAIDWANLKIDWFRNSMKENHNEWVRESEQRIEEGSYHPSWLQKIEKFET